MIFLGRPRGAFPPAVGEHATKRRGGSGGINNSSGVIALAMLRACSYCGRVHAGSCAQRLEAEARRARRRKDGRATGLRNATAWKKARRWANERDRGLCRLCFEDGKVETGYLETHHIVPLEEAPGLAFELDNLITLCRLHHEQAERGVVPRDRLRRLAAAPPSVQTE